MDYLAAAAIFRDENPWLREWVEYHHARGVERFYLFNNEDNPSSAETILRPYMEQGIVKLFHFPGKRRQMAAYRQAITMSATTTRWLALIDLDEFLLPRRCDDLREVLAEYENYSGLAVHWNVFGSSGLATRPPNQIDHFLCRARDEHPKNIHIKTILNPKCCFVEDSVSPHCFSFHTGYTVDERYEPMFSPFGPHTADYIRINHYAVRSQEDFWNVKVPRGQPSILPRRDRDYWKEYDLNDVYDDEISRRFGKRKQ